MVSRGKEGEKGGKEAGGPLYIGRRRMLRAWYGWAILAIFEALDRYLWWVSGYFPG